MRPLALVLSGGVSLGAFQAGALDELLFLLGEVDRRARREGREELRVVPDILTGASAGAMTGALVARALLHHPALRASLHRAWVEEAHLPVFLRDPPDNAVLNPGGLRELARRFIRPRAAEVVEPPPFAPEVLHLAFTLANLTGEDWLLPVRHPPGSDFRVTFFSDVRRFRLPREAGLDPASGVRTAQALEEARERWAEVAETALASGHFPLVFPPVRLPPRENRDPRAAAEPPQEGFAYVDGGLFNNEPLRPAIEGARRVDGGEVDPRRIFLLVDAHLPRSSHEPELGPETPLDVQASRLAKAIRGGASATDWLRTLRTNREIAWRDRAVELVGAVLPDADDPRLGEVAARLGEAAEEVVEEKRRVLGEEVYGEGYLADALARTRERHLPTLEESVGPVEGQRAEVAALAIFLLNEAAGLDRRSSLEVDIIHARPDETAGHRLHGFAGLFRRDWRESDYRLGRRKTRERLPAILGVEELGPFPAESHRERELYEPFLDPSEVTLGKAPREVRSEVRDLLAERAVELLEDGGVAEGFVRRFFVRRAVRRRLDRMLEL